MSYEWIRRRKRYLSFRYLFPEFVAPWIQLKRCLLRVLWFFTHPVDEFFEDLGELIAWPFVALASFFAWVLAGIKEFFKDLFEGIEAFFIWLGRLPVWTGAAIAGTFGIILTITLFILQLQTFDPIPLSAGVVRESQPVSQPAPPAPMWRPEPTPQPEFDAFSGVSTQPVDPWRPTAVATPGLTVEVDRLRLPFDSRQRIDVVSTPAVVNPQMAWTNFERLNAMNGWSQARQDRARALLHSTPYMQRQNSGISRIAPSWVTTASSISPYTQVQNRRDPAVSIVRTAPTSAAVGGPMSYELVVSNQGLEPLDSVTVHESVSAIDRVMNVEPPAHVIDNTLVWNVTNLQPREQRHLTIELRPDQLVPVDGGSTVRVKTGVAAVSMVTQPARTAPTITPPQENLNVFLPEPDLSPVAAPEPPPQENVGMILPSFDEETIVEDDPPPQQPEPSFTFEPLPVETPEPPTEIRPLEPLPRREQPVVSQTQQMQTKDTTATSSGVPIFFEMRTPTLVAVDGSVATVFEIRNPGTADLTDLVILVEVTDQLDHERGRILEHRIERLAPGDVYQTRLTTKAIRNGLARVRSTLTSAEELESTLEAEIEVSEPKAAPTQLSAIELPDQGRPTSTQ